MATVATPLMTAEEFFEWVHRPENRDLSFELERGEIVQMPLASKYHGFVCGNASRILGNFSVRRRKGYVCTNDSGVIVERDPDTVRGPDVSFYDDAKSADDMERQYAIVPPLLVVEVLSPHDKINKVIARVLQLLKRGIQLVWLIDPEGREIGVHRPGKDPYVLSANDELTGDDVFPDFRCRVAEFFDLPGREEPKSEPDASATV